MQFIRSVHLKSVGIFGGSGGAGAGAGGWQGAPERQRIGLNSAWCGWFALACSLRWHTSQCTKHSSGAIVVQHAAQWRLQVS